MVLTDQQLTYIVITLLVVVVSGMVFAFYISRKYPKKTNKQDPIYKAVFLFAVIFVLYLTAYLLGLRTRENFQNDFKYLILAGVVLVVIYTIVSWYNKRPIKSTILYVKYILKDAAEYWKSEPYKGGGYFYGMIAHKVVDVQKNKYTADLGIAEDKVDVFLCQAKAANVFRYIAVRNKFTGEDLHMVMNPNLEIQKELFGKDVISSYTNPLSDFDTQQQTTGVQGEQSKNAQGA